MDPMEVDEEYEIGEGEDLDHQPIFEQWDDNNSDRVFVDGEQIAGPSAPFRARSYSFCYRPTLIFPDFSLFFLAF
jgi:hypothetical protein